MTLLDIPTVCTPRRGIKQKKAHEPLHCAASAGECLLKLFHYDIRGYHSTHTAAAEEEEEEEQQH